MHNINVLLRPKVCLQHENPDYLTPNMPSKSDVRLRFGLSYKRNFDVMSGIVFYPIFVVKNISHFHVINEISDSIVPILMYLHRIRFNCSVFYYKTAIFVNGNKFA